MILPPCATIGRQPLGRIPLPSYTVELLVNLNLYM